MTAQQIARDTLSRHAVRPLRVGIISDTHGIWRPQVSEIFRGTEQILHAGDVGTSEILERLGQLAPVTAVRGNVENSETASLPSEIEKDIGEFRFLIRHIGSTVDAASTDLRRLLAARAVDVFVFGHSHKSYCQHLGDTLFFNPGAAGPQRFSNPLSVATMEVAQRRVSWKFWELDPGVRSR